MNSRMIAKMAGGGLARSLALGMALAAPLALQGCGGKEKAKETSAAKAQDHEHDHDHEHGKEGHGHEHHAPHGGTLVAFGEEFAHLELVLDAATGRMTGYVLDGEAENAIRLQQSTIEIKVILRKVGQQYAGVIALAAAANALTGETVGDTSEFGGQSELLKGTKEFDAFVVSIDVRGQKFEGVAFNFPKGNE